MEAAWAPEKTGLPMHTFRRWSFILWSTPRRWQPHSRHGPWQPSIWPGAPCMGAGALARLLEDLQLATSSDSMAMKALQASQQLVMHAILWRSTCGFHACHPLHAQQEHPWG